MSSHSRRNVPKTRFASLDMPFGGLFGDTAELRVLQEIVADPFSEYSHHDLMELTELSDPSVRRGIRVLLDQGIVSNVSSDRRSPLYRPNRRSKKLTALMFLAYSILDDEDGGSSMDDAIRNYCEPRSAYVDFLEMSSLKRTGSGDANGARVYLSHDVTENLSKMLQDILRKGSKEGRLERLSALH